ncbi:hypothetical protein MPSEU_000290800 [Mayamaea pseudoterrestris]|nr:hypothetical protein MPSEU_000290800 [Mayamaea pseudoterrestris]
MPLISSKTSRFLTMNNAKVTSFNWIPFILLLTSFFVLNILRETMKLYTSASTRQTTRATGDEHSKISTSTITNSSPCPKMTPEVVPVFYNLFVVNETESKRVRQLVDEQLSILLPEHQVYMHSIGYPLDIPGTTMLQHHEQGDEPLTLHSLWEYCTLQPNSKVVYLHAKGSFHPMPENEQLRRFLTAGALSEECLHLPDACNVCSSRMSPFPHPHTPGNMWLAKCQYIRQLIDPLLFQARMDDFAGKFKIGGLARYACYGLDRYAAEHWVHSHPTCKPCDLSEDSKFTWGYANIPSANFSKRLSMAPRFNKSVYEHETFCRMPPFTGSLVTDRIAEFQELYNETPLNDWWGWDAYYT